MNVKGAYVLRFEWRRVTRAPLRLSSVAVLMVAGGLSLWFGHSHVASWRTALEEGRAAARAEREQARGWLESGRRSPPERPWMDLGRARWIDVHSGAFAASEPSPLAIFCIGISDARGYGMGLWRLSSPHDQELRPEVANPEKLVMGGFDLAFVLVTFLPLVLILLTFDIAGWEREQGLAGLVVLHAGAPWRWVAARVGAQGLFASACVALLWVVGGLAGGGLGARPAMWAAGLALSLLYLLLWCGVVAVVLARGRQASLNALVLIVAWVAITIVAPAVAGLVRAPSDRLEVEVARALRDDVYAPAARDPEEDAERAYRLFPRLRDSAYARSGTRDPDRDRRLRDVRIHESTSRLTGRLDAAEVERERAALATAWINPAWALQHGLSVLAGTESSSHRLFREEVRSAALRRIGRVLEDEWGGRTMTAADLDVYAGIAPPARDYGGWPAPRVWVVLGSWATLLGVAFVVLARREE